jgi:hypothetical protein
MTHPCFSPFQSTAGVDVREMLVVRGGLRLRGRGLLRRVRIREPAGPPLSGLARRGEPALARLLRAKRRREVPVLEAGALLCGRGGTALLGGARG